MGNAEAERMVALLMAIKKDHGILLVEHDMDAVFALADRLTVMVNGQVIASGTPFEIRADAGVQSFTPEAQRTPRTQRAWRMCTMVRDTGISSVIVDKNWRHVTQITDRNVILVKGEVVFEGSSAELHAQPALLQQYFGV